MSTEFNRKAQALNGCLVASHTVEQALPLDSAVPPNARPTVKRSPVQKGMWKHSMWTHSEPVCKGTCSMLLHSGMFPFSSHLCRGRRGLGEARQRAEELKLSARSCIPSRLMGS
ncbi:hypothetical protein XENOCAPTIV_010038 [Xenoophorus captivus]|uniref:Uncharacterized protein n=1 Tax=Xenoophorus captivus TaxID=1517983 RepID=A0ABV0S1T5_9TELE